MKSFTKYHYTNQSLEAKTHSNENSLETRKAHNNTDYCSINNEKTPFFNKSKLQSQMSNKSNFPFTPQSQNNFKNSVLCYNNINTSTKKTFFFDERKDSNVNTSKNLNNNNYYYTNPINYNCKNFSIRMRGSLNLFRSTEGRNSTKNSSTKNLKNIYNSKLYIKSQMKEDQKPILLTEDSKISNGSQANSPAKSQNFHYRTNFNINGIYDDAYAIKRSKK